MISIDHECREAQHLIRAHRFDDDLDERLDELLGSVFRGIEYVTNYGGIDSEWYWHGWRIFVAEDYVGKHHPNRISVHASPRSEALR